MCGGREGVGDQRRSDKHKSDQRESDAYELEETMNGEKNALVVASTDPELPDVLDKTNPADISTPADLALNLIFEAGSAMRTQEERIAHAVFDEIIGAFAPRETEKKTVKRGMVRGSN